jgi:DNA-directed RNA polymerase subunit RPC12/RpoP
MLTARAAWSAERLLYGAIGMGKAADWLREERRNVLGHWTAFCLDCGAARRWFEEFETDLPARCAECGGPMLHRCPACTAPFSSTFAVACEECGAALREPQLNGIPIRKAAD